MNDKKCIGLYIHIPFCFSKCPYCDFFSVDTFDEQLKKRYLAAIKRELEIYSKKILNYQIISIYVGGGTPTILEGSELKDILTSCYKNFHINKRIEITVEANPGTIDREKVKILWQAGANRISLGAQVFSDKILKRIGRIHSKLDILNSYQWIREAGFKNINFDIMFGLPGQAKKEFEKTLLEAISLKPEHISLYALSVEPKTPLSLLVKKGTIKLPSDDFCQVLFTRAIDILNSYGYEHYEISNFALPDKKCIHNELYWKNQPYLGIGAGASSYIDGKRYQNYHSLNQYVFLLDYGILPIEYQEILSTKERMAEKVILQLRMREGLAKVDFLKQFKVPIEKIFSDALQKLMEQGLLAETPTHYYLTRRGILLANNVFIEFLD